MIKFAFAAAFLLSAGPAVAQQVQLLEEVPASPAAQPAGGEDMPQVILPSEEAPAAQPAEPKPVETKPAPKQAKAPAKKAKKAAAPAAKSGTRPAAAAPAEAKPAASAEAKAAVAEAAPAAKPAEPKPAAAAPAKAEAKTETKPAVKAASAPAAVGTKPAPAAAPAAKPAAPVAAKAEPKPAVPASPAAPKPEVKPVAQPAPQPVKGAGFAVQKTHTVTGGDTLWDLSGKYYKDPYKWGKIYNANLDRVNNPDLIYPKNELLIPDLTEEVKPEVKPEPKPVIAGADTVKEPELQASEVVQPEEPAAALPPPGKPAAAELQEAMTAYDRADLSEEMPDHQKEWGTGVRIVPDGWQEDGVITARESADDDSLEESLSLDGAVVRLSMARSGARRGDYLTVYMIGSDAFDKNGKRIGRELQRVGMLEVIEADGRKAKARVIDAVTGIVKGYVVKKK